MESTDIKIALHLLGIVGKTRRSFDVSLKVLCYERLVYAII